MSLLSQELLLPITQSGLSFFQDPFSEQRRKHFQMALKNITDRHGFNSPDLLSSYRSLRQRDLKEENQAISVTDQHNVREITLDVKDFKDGDLSVKAEGHSVEVEGHVERKEGNSISTHSFRRRFSLPSNVDMVSVTSIISSDGILTISAPKKNQPDNPNEFKIPIENRIATDVNVKTQKTSSENASSTSSQEKKSTNTQTKAETMTHHSTSDNSCTSTSATEADNKKVKKEKCSQERSSVVVEPVTPLPVMLKGSFFEDSFFHHVHRDFVAAMEGVLKRFGAESSTAENFKQYRSLRDDDFSNETQAYTLSEDDSSYKIILDAQGFKNSDVQVRVVGKSLVVEGRMEKTINDSVSNLTFHRRFALPRHTDANDITAALSSDGVLTILAKKKCNALKEVEQIIPILEENKHDRQTTEKTQELRSVGQQTSINETQSEHHTTNEEKENQVILQQQQLFQQQEKLLQQQAEQIHKQEQMISIQEKQLIQQKQDIERQKTHNENLQRDAEQLKIKTKNENVEEKDENEARLQQQSLQEEEVQLLQQQQQQQQIQNEQMLSLQQEQIRKQKENECMKAQNQKLERDVEQTQNQINKQNSQTSNSSVVEKVVKSEITHNEETHQSSAHQEENEQNSFTQMCSDDTLASSDNPVWIPNIDSLEPGFSNIKKFECTGTENLLEKASSSVHMEGNYSALEENDSSSNTSAKTLTEPAEGTQVPAARANVSLPVERRGNFLQDSFFGNDHKIFQAAMCKVLERFGVASTDDNLKAYRILRQSVSVEESQAAQITDEENNYKVVLDVSEFVEGDVKVKADGQMLVVEGQAQKKEGNSTSSRNFRRCFALPTLVDMDAVTSALSSDGVLTITAPKKDQMSIRDDDTSCRIKKEVSQTSQMLSRSSTKGWREQTSYHESSSGGGADQQTSRRTLKSSSTSGNIL